MRQLRYLFYILFVMILSLSAGCGNHPETGASAMSEFRLLGDNTPLLFASSELENTVPGTPGKYGVTNLFDGSTETAWVEGEEDYGSTSYLLITLPEGTDSLDIHNGLGKSNELFRKNNRVKEISITLYAAYSPPGHVTEKSWWLFYAWPVTENRSHTLEDRAGFQRLDLDLDWNNIKKKGKELIAEKAKEYPRKGAHREYILKMEIKSVYRGSKWNDTCISEIQLDGKSNSREEPAIQKVYTGEDGHAVLFDTETGEGRVLVRKKESVYQVVETSPDKEWVILIRMAAEPGEGRRETIYELYNVRENRRISLDDRFGELYGFETRGDLLYLKFSSNSGGKEDSIPVRQL